MLSHVKPISIKLPASKSISNRLLIIQKLCKQQVVIKNISKANDTKVLQKALHSSNTSINAEDAGTAFRFLTAYYAATTSKTVELTGTSRMCERPIKDLVEALKQLGCKIQYGKEINYPPLRIEKSKITKNLVEVNGALSSQFVSALCLIAPTLKQGLSIHITSHITSEPYLKMTLDLMHEFGIKSSYKNNRIAIAAQAYKAKKFTVENDWSSAVYFYCMAVLKKKYQFSFKLLYKNSIQGDCIAVKLFEKFGIRSVFVKNELTITNTLAPTIPKRINCTDFPDLAVPLIALCAIRFPTIRLKGLNTLLHKESNRIVALQQLFSAVGVSIFYKNDVLWFEGKFKKTKKTIYLNTFNDHRIAMCGALLQTVGINLIMDDKNCVNKSFPGFWTQVKKLDTY